MFAKWGYSLGVWASMLIVVTNTMAENVYLTGAGASFPYPLYAKWADIYKKKYGVKVNYQSIGSGAGIKQIKEKTVDFGASDKPLSREELRKAGLIQFPAIIGAVVPVIHVPEFKSDSLKLTGQVLADIYLGKIKQWNHQAIQDLNPYLTLPKRDITVVYRSDGSGTSYIFTRYLSEVSKDFQTSVGVGAAVKWPVGLGGKGNEGVAAYVRRIPGAIGYVEYAHAKKSALLLVQLKNRSGVFVKPSSQAFRAAAANADWEKTPGFAVDLTNAAGKNSWPMTSASFILLHKHPSDLKKGKAILHFFAWGFKHGAAEAKKLNYVPLPDNVMKLIETAWKKKVTDGAGQPIW